MKIKQFEDKGLSHYSYAVLSECQDELVLIDPTRDITPYLEFAQEHNAKIIAVVETHPHADFVSGHLELHRRTGATLYCSNLVGADYPHSVFDEGNTIKFGKIKLSALNTPGHSPDSICVLLEHEEKQKAVFTGDTLFIGDCGRPDLRENVGNFRAKQKELAKQMYHSLREKLLPLLPETIVYPAHGAGTLCGKALSEANQSTIGEEKEHNWSLKTMAESDFVEALTSDQPFIPHYFVYDVEVNKAGAPDLEESLARVPELNESELLSDHLIIDGRPEEIFKEGHLLGAINIQNGGKFETWLGSVLKPEEKCYLIGTDVLGAREMLRKASKIGYETKIMGTVTATNKANILSPKLDVEDFKKHTEDFTIVDVRNQSEVKEGKLFANSIAIPLPELRERMSQVPTDKPIVVHCAGGYRSAVGSSLLEAKLQGNQKVYDLGNSVKEFTPQN